MKHRTVNKKVNRDTRIVVSEVTDNMITSLQHFAAKEFTPDALIEWWQARGAKARFDNVPVSQHPFGPDKNLSGFGRLCREAWTTGWKAAC